MVKNIRQNGFRIAVLLAALVFAAGITGCRKAGGPDAGSKAFAVDKVYEKGPLTVHVRLDKDKLTIAETMLLELEAAVSGDYEVRMPKMEGLLKDFGIIDWNNIGDRLDPNNRVVRTYRYRLEPFLSGKYAVPAFTFEFEDPNGVQDANSTEKKKYELSTEPIDVEVASLLGEQRSGLTIADIEGIVEVRSKSGWWRYAILAAVLVIAAAGVWFYRRRDLQAELVRIFKPAHEIAYERLKALIADDLIAAGRIKEFYERISDILRHYIEHRFDIRAPERTTEEFLSEVQSADALSAADKKGLKAFLEHCDLVKFAKYSPNTEQIQQTFDLVKDFIEKTRTDEKKIDVTDKSADSG